MSGKAAVHNYGVAAIADVLGCFGIPTGTALQIYQDILDKRSQEAMEILLSEVRQGNFSGIDQNDAVSIISRFQRDAMEGVARNNLRLMARVINGMAEKNQLKAPSFLKYANVLASLTDEEIEVLALMLSDKNENKRDTAYLRNSLDRKTAKDTAHKIFGDNLTNIQQALVRTGLVFMELENSPIEKGSNSLPMYGENKSGKPNIRYNLTPLMKELGPRPN